MLALEGLSQPAGVEPVTKSESVRSEIRSDASPQLVLVIVCAGVVLASLDLFIVNVALPQIGHDFHLRGGALADLSWVLNAYAIVYAAFLVLFGRLAERFRRERGFLLGVLVFVVASAACGAASSLPVLVVFRVVQAAGAALLTPTSLGLILATWPAERRQGRSARGPRSVALRQRPGRSWVDFWSRSAGAGCSWSTSRWACWRSSSAGGGSPRVPGHPVPVPDALSALLLTGGVGALVLGLVKGGGWGWGSGKTVAALGAAGALLILFSIHTAGHRNPLIDRSLLRLRPLLGASAVALVFMAAFSGMLLSRVLWAQEVWHWSALATGLGIAPGPIMVPVFSFLVAGRLISRLGPAG